MKLYLNFMLSLSPRGESGLKSSNHHKTIQSKSSLPTRGEWIEIAVRKFTVIGDSCLSPRGESGLKSVAPAIYVGTFTSLPTRGEWIEIDSRGA